MVIPKSLKTTDLLAILHLYQKFLKKSSLVQINDHLLQNKLYGNYQSGYRKNHSCETAMFRVIGDIQKITNDHNHAALLMLDLIICI